MAYRQSYRSYSNSKSYSGGVKFASFMQGMASGFKNKPTDRVSFDMDGEIVTYKVNITEKDGEKKVALRREKGNRNFDKRK